MSTSVKFFHSDMPNAPVLTGAAASLVDVLDAVLVDGFNTKTLTSLVISGGIATATFTGTFAGEKDAVVAIAGATTSGGSINGEHKALSVTGTTVTFATALGNQTATGTVTMKMAPIGWTRAFTGTNKRAFKSSDVGATACYLRIDDTDPQNARVVGYETMSDIDTGTGAFPTSTQMSGGLYWPKSYQTNSTARSWAIFGDERAFYLCVAPGSVTTHFSSYAFGDFGSYKSGDTYGCVLTGNHATGFTNSASVADGDVAASYTNSYAHASNGLFVPRHVTFVGSARAAYRTGLGHNATTGLTYSGNANYGIGNYPNLADNSLTLSKLLLIHDNTYRGEFVGLRHVPQNLSTNFATKDRVAGTGDMSGKTLFAVRPGYSSSSATFGTVFFDITGPWR
jgi:hypothetical protein